MVVEALLGLLVGVSTFITGLFPAWEVPPFVAQTDDLVNQLLSYIDGFGGWVDFVWIGTAVFAAFATWIVCLIIKTARAVASYVPLFGGAG